MAIFEAGIMAALDNLRRTNQEMVKEQKRTNELLEALLAGDDVPGPEPKVEATDPPPMVRRPLRLTEESRRNRAKIRKERPRCTCQAWGQPPGSAHAEGCAMRIEY